MFDIQFTSRTEDLIQDFLAFGEIGHYYRPFNLAKKIPSSYAFIRYYKKDDAENAITFMDGKVYGESMIRVFDASKQDSYFTQDTGELNHFLQKNLPLKP